MIEPHPDAGFIGSAVEMPLVFAEGKTVNACITSTIDAIATTIAVTLALGESVPSPASQNKREIQVNIRLTADEKLQIEEAARRAGFRSISDFLRTAALRHAS